MTQPTGSTSLNSAWIAKGLKAGIYVTESGAFVFDDSASSVAASPNLSWTTNADNTGPSTPYGDLIIDRVGGGSTDIGYLHATSGMSAAFGDDMTFVFDCSPVVGIGTSYYDNSRTEFLSWGTSGSGSLGIFGSPKSNATEYKVECYVQGPIDGPTRGANIVFNTAAHRRLAFRYRRGYPVDIFVNGVIQTANWRADDYSGPTPLPSSDLKRLFGWRPYTITPTSSHLLVFSAALSDSDIATLAGDPWLVFSGGGAVDGTATGATLTGASSITPGSAAGTAAGTASGTTLTGTSGISAGAATGGSATGSFTTAAMENNTGSGLLASTSVAWTWYEGAIGAAPTSTTHGTGTTNGSGILTVTGLPVAAGFLLARTTDSSGVYYQSGTPA